MILAPFFAASMTSSVNFSRLRSTAPRSDDAWIQATFTVRGGAGFFAPCGRAGLGTAHRHARAGTRRRTRGMTDLHGAKAVVGGTLSRQDSRERPRPVTPT